jgi:hypothetical protein
MYTLTPKSLTWSHFHSRQNTISDKVYLCPRLWKKKSYRKNDDLEITNKNNILVLVKGGNISFGLPLLLICSCAIQDRLHRERRREVR